MPARDPENLPPIEDILESSKFKRFLKDFCSDPAILFTVVTDPLIFMTPEHLGVEGFENAEEMHDVIMAQAVAAIMARAVASYLHVNYPDYKHTGFMDKLPLRISGYTHLGLGLFLAASGQAREAAIAIPLGIGNLQLTGDVKSIINAIDKILPDEMPAIFNAYKSPNANFAIAQFAVLLPAMGALADALNEGHANVELLARSLPALPLLVASYYIGKNVVADEKMNAGFRESGQAKLAIHNEGYPVVLVGATAATGGAVGLWSLSSRGVLSQSFNDLGAGISNAAYQYGAAAWNVVSSDNYTPALSHVSNPNDAYVAAICLASLTIGAAYTMLENKFGTLFRPGHPTQTIVELDPEP